MVYPGCPDRFHGSCAAEDYREVTRLPTNLSDPFVNPHYLHAILIQSDVV